MPDHKDKKITIIGLGKVGYALLNKLIDCDYYIYSAIDSSENIIKKIKRERKVSFIKKNITSEIVNNSDVIIISVKDDTVENICRKLTNYNCDFRNKIIFHTSGVLSSKLLTKYFKNKENCGSFQPVQTFNRHCINQKEKFNSIYILLEGGENFIRLAKRICKDIGAKYLRVNEKQKKYFHIISVFASNYLITYFDLICNSILKRHFNDKKIFELIQPLILTTIKNIGAEEKFYGALSGPIERGDINTIDMHLKELRNSDIDLLSLYKTFGLKTLNLAIKKKSINKKTALKIKKLLLYGK